MLKFMLRKPLLLSVAWIPALLVSPLLQAQNGTIRGRVFCADTQKPARFAAVILSGSGQRAYTQTDGSFVIEDVVPGDYRFEILYPGYLHAEDPSSIQHDDAAEVIDTPGDSPSQVEAKVLPGRTTNATITLQRGAELGGHVAYDDGSPAINAVVTAHHVKESTDVSGPRSRVLLTESGGSEQTDSRGRFRIDGLPAGKYILSVRNTERYAPFSNYLGDTGDRTGATQVDIRAGEARDDLEMQINLSTLHQVRGVLLNAQQQPIRKTYLKLKFAGSGSSEVQLAWTADDGSFAFASVPDGNFTIESDDPKVKVSATSISIKGQDMTDLILIAKSPQ